MVGELITCVRPHAHPRFYLLIFLRILLLLCLLILILPLPCLFIYPLKLRPLLLIIVLLSLLVFLLPLRLPFLLITALLIRPVIFFIRPKRTGPTYSSSPTRNSRGKTLNQLEQGNEASTYKADGIDYAAQQTSIQCVGCRPLHWITPRTLKGEHIQKS